MPLLSQLQKELHKWRGVACAPKSAHRVLYLGLPRRQNATSFNILLVLDAVIRISPFLLFNQVQFFTKSSCHYNMWLHFYYLVAFSTSLYSIQICGNDFRDPNTSLLRPPKHRRKWEKIRMAFPVGSNELIIHAVTMEFSEHYWEYFGSSMAGNFVSPVKKPKFPLPSITSLLIEPIPGSCCHSICEW